MGQNGYTMKRDETDGGRNDQIYPNQSCIIFPTGSKNFGKRSLIVKFILTQAFECQSAVKRYLSKTADWQSKARVKINFTIREHFQELSMNPGRASSIFNRIKEH